MYSSSATNFQYLAQNSPEAFQNPKFLATNPSGDTLYAVRIEVLFDLDLETGEVQSNRESVILSQHKITSGESVTYKIDTAIGVIDLHRCIEFYVLSDYIGVLVAYDRGVANLTQFLLILDRKTQNARMVHRKTVKTPAISGSAQIGYGKLNHGQVLVTGSQGPFDGDKNVVGYLIPANPLDKGAPVDITRDIAAFERFLFDISPAYRIFDRGVFVDETALYFLIASEQDLTELVGKYLFNPKENEDRSSLLFLKDSLPKQFLQVSHLNNTSQRGRNLWLFFNPPDFSQLSTFKWRLYIWFLPAIVKTMVQILNFTIWMRTFDGGLLVKGFIKFMQWAFGPSLIPPHLPKEISVLCSVDLQQLTLREVKREFPLKYEGPSSYFDVGFDCDQDGGLVLAEFLEKQRKRISVTYYPSMSKPPSLAKMSEHSAYRWYPAFEKSPMMRRALGVVDY